MDSKEHRVLAGKDKPSFQDMYRQEYDRVYKYAYTLLLNRENAEDIVQDTFIAAFRSYEGFDPNRASVGTWLCRIAHNKAMDLVRSAAYRTHAEWSEMLDFGDENQETGKAIDERETVLYLYSRLTPAEREFLNMRYALELKDKEVAAILGLSEKATNKRYQRLLKKCLGILSPNGAPGLSRLSGGRDW